MSFWTSQCFIYFWGELVKFFPGVKSYILSFEFSWFLANISSWCWSLLPSVTLNSWTMRPLSELYLLFLRVLYYLAWAVSGLKTQIIPKWMICQGHLLLSFSRINRTSLNIFLLKSPSPNITPHWIWLIQIFTVLYLYFLWFQFLDTWDVFGHMRCFCSAGFFS